MGITYLDVSSIPNTLTIRRGEIAKPGADWTGSRFTSLRSTEVGIGGSI
jgi:hypothetical protein